MNYSTYNTRECKFEEVVDSFSWREYIYKSVRRELVLSPLHHRAVSRGTGLSSLAEDLDADGNGSGGYYLEVYYESNSAPGIHSQLAWGGILRFYFSHEKGTRSFKLPRTLFLVRMDARTHAQLHSILVP